MDGSGSNGHKFEWFTGPSALIFTPLAALVTRIAVGWGFFIIGHGNVETLDTVKTDFASLGIPNPDLMAPIVAYAEWIGGACLILGLGTRIFSLILVGIMGVALYQAHQSELIEMAKFADGFYPKAHLMNMQAIPYLCGVLWLAARGAGIFSLDAIVNIFLRKEE